MFATVTATVTVNAAISAQLIISWHEVDRLVDKAEYAAALLVAAVNVEFILWEHLRHFAPTTSLTAASDRVKSTWGKIRADQSDKVTLSGLIAVAQWFSTNDQFQLSPPWDPLARNIDAVRNCIAHERGYFASLTQLKVSAWPEATIRKALKDAESFCHGNAPQ